MAEQIELQQKSNPKSNTVDKTSEDEPEENSNELINYIKPDIPAAEIQSLIAAYDCTVLFPLFKELVRTQLPDFLVKMAFLIQLSSNRDKTTWTPQEMVKEFYWAQETSRKRIVQQLSRSGWLIFEEGTYKISTLGKTVLSVISALPKTEDLSDALGANISALSLLESYANKPNNNLRMFLNELVRIDEDIVNTLQSKSEYLVRKLNRQVRTQFDVAVKSREYLQNLSSSDFSNYRLKQQIHEKLSAFHSRVSQVQRAQNDLVARKIILADKSLTQHDVDTFLINSSAEQLAQLGRKFISHPIHVADLVSQLMVYEAEWQMEKVHSQEQRRGWSDVELAEESQENIASNNRFLGFMTEINHNLSKHEEFALEKFIPAENWAASGFRFSMLSVLESHELPDDFGIEDETKCPKISITPEESDKGLELKTVILDDDFSGVKEIVKGMISREKEQSDGK